MACSERKRLANQQNAAKSTGPRTDEGKDRSRRNAMRHGLAAVVLLPTEDAGELDRRVGAFQDALAGDDDGMALILAERLGYLSLRMRRCFDAESATAACRARGASAAYEQERHADAQHTLDYIANDPATGRRRLMGSPEGLDLLVATLEKLRDDVDGLWTTMHGYRLDDCCGRRPGQAPASRTDGLTQVLTKGAITKGDPTGLRQAEVDAIPPERRNAWAQAELVAIIDAELARLHAHRPTLDHARFARDRAEAGRRAGREVDKPTTLAHRYEAAADLAFDRAWRQLETYRRRQQRADIEARTIAQSENDYDYVDERAARQAIPAPVAVDPPAPAAPAALAGPAPSADAVPAVASFGKATPTPASPGDAATFTVGKPPIPPPGAAGRPRKRPRRAP